MKYGDNDMLASSYVRYGDKWWNVSTCNRPSSAAEVGIYAETLVWEWDATERKRGAIFGQDDGPRDSMHAHFSVCQRLVETGKMEDES